MPALLLTLVRLLALLALAPSAFGQPGPAPAPLPAPPADPAGLTTVVLENGLEVWIHPAPDAEGQAGAWLVVGAGSMAESDEQAGAAYLAKRAAGLGTPGAPAHALDTLRTGFRPHEQAPPPSAGGHAMLAHDGVIYTLAFDAADDRAWDLALTHYADLLAHWRPDDAALAEARVQAARRLNALAPEEAAPRRFMRDLFPGQPLGERHLIPGHADLAATTDDAVRAFIDERYRASNATLIVVGPVDPGEVLARVRRTTRAVPTRTPTPARAFTPGVAGRISAIGVDGYGPAEVALLAVSPGGPQRDPAARAVLDALAADLIATRLRPAAGAADAGVRSVDAVVQRWIGGSHITEVAVRVDPEGLNNAGLALATEAARIAREGFTDEEIRHARARVLAAFDPAARPEPGVDPESLIASLAVAARTLPRGTPGRWLDPNALAQAAARTLAATTNDGVDRHARAAIAPEGLACVLIGPDAARPPGRSDAEAVLRAATDPAPAPRAGALPDEIWPGRTPGRVVRLAHEPITDVWTAQLSNGVLVRARRTPGTDRALVRVTVADGVPREDARTLGRTRDAAAAWAYPRAGAFDAETVRAWSLARGLSLRASVSDHLLTLDVTADMPSGVGDGLALAGALLARPGVDPSYAPRVRPAQPDQGPGLRRLGELLFAPADARARQAPPPGRVDPAQADAWLAELAAAPLEVSVVGDLAPEEALELAAATLGALPAREPPSTARTRAWSPLPRAESTERVAMAGASPEAVLGVVFADATDLATLRPMTIAAAAINEELRRMRDAGELQAAPRAWVWMGAGIPGRSTLIVRCAHASDPEAALRAIEAAIERVASGESPRAVLDREITRARRAVDDNWSRPAFWSERLAQLSVHGLDEASIAEMHGAYDSLTPEGVRETLARAVAAGVHKRVIVTPE